MPFLSPRVSVIIPTYNRAPVLSRAIESALAQTVKDIEIIVVDDASTDDTSSIVHQHRDSRIRYIRLETNTGGPAEPTNHGIREAQASMVALLDSDDSARPLWLESLCDSLAPHPDIGLAWGQHAICDPNGKLLSIAFRDPFVRSEPQLLPRMLKWTPGSTGLMIRRSVFDEVGLFDPNSGILSDLELTIRFAVSARWGIRVVPKVLLDYSRYAGSGSNTVTSTYLRAVRYCLEKHKHTIAAYPHIEAEWHYRISRVCSSLSMSSESDDAVSLAISLNPHELKYYCYRFAQRLGLLGPWRAIGAVRSWLDSEKRKLYYKVRGDRAASLP